MAHSDALSACEYPSPQVLREENAKLREQMIFANEAPRTIPPPGDGKKIFETDPCLNDHRIHLEYRWVDGVLRLCKMCSHFYQLNSLSFLVLQIRAV